MSYPKLTIGAEVIRYDGCSQTQLVAYTLCTYPQMALIITHTTGAKQWVWCDGANDDKHMHGKPTKGTLTIDLYLTYMN